VPEQGEVRETNDSRIEWILLRRLIRVLFSRFSKYFLIFVVRLYAKLLEFTNMAYRELFNRMHPLTRLMMLLLVVFVSLLVVFAIGMLAAFPLFGEDMLAFFRGETMLAAKGNIWISRYIQVLSHLGMFIVPAFAFGMLVSRRPAAYLRINTSARGLSLLTGMLIMVAALPLVNYLMHLNMTLHLPDFLSPLETWMRKTEEAAEVMTAYFLGVDTWQGLMFNIFMIAVIPALGEELIFRGIVLRLMGEWTRNLHMAVWISAFLFSTMHMQFFSFLPRLLLGVLLGYMFVWSGRLWVPVFAHFFNNAAAVTVYFLHHNGYVNFNMDELSLEVIPWPWVLLSMLGLLVLFVVFRSSVKAADTLRFGRG
jgi:uncharacterized protein